MCSEKYNEKLIALINHILNKLSDERKRYLEEELNNVIKTNQAIKLLIAYDIAKYLNENKYYYVFRGNINSSYIAYELGINNVDCFKLNIIPEQCYGIDYKNNYIISLNVGTKVLRKVLKHIDDVYKGNLYRLKSINCVGRIYLNITERLYVIDNTKKYNTKAIKQNGIEYESLTAEDISNDDNIFRISIKGKYQIDLVDETLKIINERNDLNIDYDNYKELKNKSRIINKLCNYSSSNIDKSYFIEVSNKYINEMIRDLNPKSYNDLVKVCCLLHCYGSFDDDQLNLNNSISSIDDVYDYLINININKEEAFHISEIVGKGKFQDISESLNDRLPFEFIKLCNEFTHLESKGFVASYLNQDMFTMYLYDKYPNEISEAYLKVFKDINHEGEYKKLEINL